MKIPLIFLFLLLSIGCTRQPEAGVYKDESYIPATYMEKGCPPIDKAWDKEDFKALTLTLEQIRSENKYALPRKGSPASGAYFSKMLDEGHLAFITDSTVNDLSKPESLLDLIDYCSALYYLYLEGDQPFQGFSHEITAVDIFLNRMSRASLQDATRVRLQTEMLQEDYNDVAALKEPNEQMARGWENMVAGLFQSLSSDLGKIGEVYLHYEKEDMILLAKESADLLALSGKYFSAEQKSAVLGQLERMEKDHPYIEIRKIMKTAAMNLHKPE